MVERQDVIQLLSQYAHADDDAQHASDIYEDLGRWSTLFAPEGRFDIREFEAANLLPETLPGAHVQVGPETIRRFATTSLSARGEALRPSMHMNFNTTLVERGE